MTPEATYSALHLWRLMCDTLAGEQPLPELSAQPGRVHRLPEPSSVEADAQQRDAEMVAAKAWRTLADDCEGATHD